MNKNEIKFNGSNNKEYKIELIWNSNIYIKNLKTNNIL